MNERAETRVESTVPKRTLVIEDNDDIVPASETALISTPIQNPLQVSQEVPTILITANTLLLFTVGLKFYKIAFGAIFENAKFSCS